MGPCPRRGASTAQALIAGGVIVALVVAIAFASWYPSAGAKPTVRVFGLVSSTGAGSHPMEMVFTDSQSGNVSGAPVVEGGYSVQLPNHRVYNVTMKWGGNYTWQAGAVDMGQLVVDMSEGSMMAQSYNVVQPTPDSEVMVNGTIAWQMVTSHPTAVKFTAGSNETFQAAVTGLSFGIRLPNLMTYEVEVQATNSTGYSEWFYFHPLEIYAGTSVVGLTVKLGT